MKRGEIVRICLARARGSASRALTFLLAGVGRRHAFILLPIIMAVGVAIYTLNPPEPSYRGKCLRQWLTELVEVSHELAARAEDSSDQEARAEQRALTARQAAATAAVRRIGVRALPHLLGWIRSSARPSPLRDKLQEWLDNQSLVSIRLRERQDYSEEAFLGFQALGAAARPALPQLRKLLADPAACDVAAACLVGIGPDALPVLAWALSQSNSLVQNGALAALRELAPAIGAPALPILLAATTNSGSPVRQDALIALGDLGTAARGIVPWLVSLIDQATNDLAGAALRVAGQVTDAPDRLLPLFRGRLTNSTLAFDAAFALARSGPAGVPPLLSGLTNENPTVRAAAITALRPGFRRNGSTAAPRPPGYRFSVLSSQFEQKRWARWTTGYSPANLPNLTKQEALRAAPRLAKLLDHPNPAVRLQIVQLLARYGRPGALGLSRAAIDDDQAVREAAQASLTSLDVEIREGAIVRGPKDQRTVALVFSGHHYAEGGATILDELARHKATASFFFTGDFLTNRTFTALIERLAREGHYLGPYSDQHLLYCSAEGAKRTLVTREQFQRDLSQNSGKIQWFNLVSAEEPYLLPPHERHNLEIAEWAREIDYRLINCTPGTRSDADCTIEGSSDFVPSQAIFESILAKEQQDAHGLNGFILLFHIGSGPDRADKFHTRFGALLDHLGAGGYRFVAVDELLDPKAGQDRLRTPDLVELG